jgi:predicted amidohydrolase
MTSGPDVESNLSRAEALIAEAVRRGAQLVVLPENFALLSTDEQAKLRHAERLPGPGCEAGAIVGRMSDVARSRGVELILGGMPEVSDDPSRVHNTSVYLGAEGQLLGAYRKRHLFDVDIPDGTVYRESAGVAAGDETVVVDRPFGGVGLSVCYDVRFPELYREQSARGALLLTVPAAFTLHTGRDHWHVLLRARAIENLCFVLAAAQYGRHSERRVTYGHALIVDPWGQVLAECGDAEGVALAELDFVRQARLRTELPCLGHRRL